MIKCIAIDDEPLALEQLKSYISKVSYFELAGSCCDAFDAMKILSQQKVDVIFIDINMPDLNGMDYVRSLIDPPLIVFTTAYSQYAIEAYKVNTIDYLLKPFSLEDFQKTALKIKQRIERKQEQTATASTSDTIYVKSEFKIIKINIHDINFIQGMSEYLKIYVDTAPKPIMTRLSMKKMEDRLPSDTFMRIHRSYIVNLNKIKEIKKLLVIMDKGTSIPIGEQYKDKLIDYVHSRSF